MQRRTKLLTAGVVVVASGAAGTSMAIAAAGDDDATDTPITEPALSTASEAALEHTGGGVVTGTEVGDEESLYEVEVRLPDGTQVDVQLDASFAVVGENADAEGDQR